MLRANLPAPSTFVIKSSPLPADDAVGAGNDLRDQFGEREIFGRGQGRRGPGLGEGEHLLDEPGHVLQLPIELFQIASLPGDRALFHDAERALHPRDRGTEFVGDDGTLTNHQWKAQTFCIAPLNNPDQCEAE